MGLQGITITGGYNDAGTAVLCFELQAPEIENCIFSNNVATGLGGAVLSFQGRLRLTNCRFSDNHALQGGAIASVALSRFELQDCVFTGNSAQDGGALFCQNADSTTVTNCTFAQNRATLGANFHIVDSTTAPQTADHCILAFGLDGEGAYWDGNGSLVFSCVDIFGNEGGDWTRGISDQAQTNGNLQLDPWFCGDANPAFPFSLAADSPCAPENNPECGLIGALPVGCSGLSDTGNPPLAYDFQLQDCFPNPFNPSTTISFHMKKDSEASLRIFDANGRLIRSLVTGYFATGEHRTIWHGTDNHGRPVGSGVYFAQLNVGSLSMVRKMVLLK